MYMHRVTWSLTTAYEVNLAYVEQMAYIHTRTTHSMKLTISNSSLHHKGLPYADHSSPEIKIPQRPARGQRK